MSRLPPFPLNLDSRRLAWPVDWRTVFGRDAPLIVEIGFGNGQFLVALAEARPDANVIGLEISQPALRRAEQRIRVRSLANLRVVYGQAKQFLWSNCRPHSLGEIYINFPDPWPKAAHHHRRLLNERFLELLATRLQLSGRLEVATDHADYAEVIAGLLRCSPHFEELEGGVGGPRLVQTKYERKARAEGRACRYFSYLRNAFPAQYLFPVPQEMPMPHAILDCPLSLHEIAARFEASSQTSDDHVVRFVALFQGPKPPQLLIDAYVEEEPLSQRVAVSIRSREATALEEPAGEIIVGLHDLGFPRPTPAIHGTIYYVANWLQSLSPEIRLRHTNVQVEAIP